VSHAGSEVPQGPVFRIIGSPKPALNVLDGKLWGSTRWLCRSEPRS